MDLRVRLFHDGNIQSFHIRKVIPQYRQELLTYNDLR